jgi:hypothetical protein
LVWFQLFGGINAQPLPDPICAELKVRLSPTVCWRISSLAVAAVLMFSGCGSSSPDVSEGRANRIAQKLIGLSSPQCVPTGKGSELQTFSGGTAHQIPGSSFTCSGSRQGHPLTVEVTVSRGEESLLISHCEDGGATHRPCRELFRGSGKSIGG